MGHRLPENQVQVFDRAGAAPVRQKLGHHRHGHDARDDCAFHPSFFGDRRVSEPIGCGRAPDIAEIGHLIVGGHLLHGSDLVTQFYLIVVGQYSPG